MTAQVVKEWTDTFDKYGIWMGVAVAMLWFAKWARPWADKWMAARVEVQKRKAAVQEALEKESEARVLQVYQQIVALQGIDTRLTTQSVAIDGMASRLAGIESKLTSSPPTKQRT